MKFSPVTIGSAIAVSCMASYTVADAPSSKHDIAELRAAAQFISSFANELDCENVGHIESGEVDEHLPPIFLRFDVDRSRAITRKELLSEPYLKDKTLLSVSYSLMDTDGSGSVEFQELGNYMIEAIELLDEDNNGELHPHEIQNASKAESTQAQSQ